jgi:hypothetical protein
VSFSGTAWSSAVEESVLRELRVELGRRSLDVCVHSDVPSASPASAFVTLLANDLDTVSIVPSRLQNEGGFSGRTIRVSSIPEDARALAIAQAVDEALRTERSPEPVPPPPPPPSREVAKDVTPPVGAPSSRFRVGVAIGPALQVAPSSGAGAAKTMLAAGGSLRVAATYANFGGSLGVVFAKSTQLDFGSVALNQFRLPVDVSARARLRTGSLEGTFDLGLLLALLREEYVPARRTYVEVEPGIRAGLTLAWGERIVPWVGASIEVLPAPYDLRFAPVGSLGRTASLWLGFSLGMEMRWP